MAQVGPKWNTKRARAAVKAIKINGKSPLHAVDDFVDAGIDAGQAAKVALLVAAPLGLSITDFDPDNDGGVNLQQIVADGQHLDGSFGPTGTLNATLYAMLAMRPLDLLMPTNSITFVRAAQEAAGGWNYAGDATGDYADVDTTSSAIEALIAAGVAPSDPAVRKGLAWLATQYSPSTGAWSSFGADDANSTAVAMIAISAAGYDPTAPCWRNAVASSLKNDAYPSPAAWLRSQQLGSGRIASANDAYGVNTFATSQSVEALMRGFLPFVSAPRQHCKAPKV